MPLITVTWAALEIVGAERGTQVQLGACEREWVDLKRARGYKGEVHPLLSGEAVNKSFRDETPFGESGH